MEAEAELIWRRQGRSLPYGEGASFWALAEVVKAQAGVLHSDTLGEAGAKLAEMVAELMPGAAEAGWVARHLETLVGLGTGEPARGDRSEVFAAWLRFACALSTADAAQLPGWMVIKTAGCGDPGRPVPDLGPVSEVALLGPQGRGHGPFREAEVLFE